MNEHYILIGLGIWVLLVTFMGLYFTRMIKDIIKIRSREYEDLVNSTAVYPRGPHSDTEFLYLGLALNGEAGEVAEKIKKIVRDKEKSFQDLSDLDRKSIAKELGDVLWYTTTLGKEIGYSLEDIMKLNSEKLIKRRETGTLHGSGDDRETYKDHLWEN